MESGSEIIPKIFINAGKFYSDQYNPQASLHVSDYVVSLF